MAVIESESKIDLGKDESETLDYFLRCNYINKQLITEEKYFIKYMGDRWSDLSQSQKDALLDLLYVDDKIRNPYMKSNVSKNYSEADSKPNDEDSYGVPNSFPRLFINSGQKINVDFENDLWTWRDEHSGPFSWMSRSQQDLTLADFDEENISKPQPKLLKIDVEADNQRKAPQQFSHAGDAWTADIIDDFKKKEQQIILTPKITYPEKMKNKHFLEEVNPAFNESCENLPNGSPTTFDKSDMNNRISKSSVVSGHKVDDNHKTQNSSLKKNKNMGSVNRSSVNGTIADNVLLHKRDTELSDSKRGFCNTVMESEWSTFVGAKNLPLAPEPMVMDRSDVKITDSPYQGDDVRLIQASPSSTQQTSYLSPAHSEWSEESTPDHTTYLLKGMQSPQHHRKTSNPLIESKHSQDEVPSLDADEILKVERKGDKIIVTTENQRNSDADIPTTGFDFLDNW
ncbi:hypothetical protein Btru_048990 [Bulinus truncatus]|nr:hypothetical protein Btru_048990 [Bulinus truncatus]